MSPGTSSAGSMVLPAFPDDGGLRAVQKGNFVQPVPGAASWRTPNTTLSSTMPAVRIASSIRPSATRVIPRQKRTMLTKEKAW